METAGNRTHGTTHQKPLTLFAESEKPFLKPLPDVQVEAGRLVPGQSPRQLPCSV